MALVAADQPECNDVIVNARDYKLSLQADEAGGLTPDSSTCGGIGYSRDERSDISNMQFALEALRTLEEFKPSAEFAAEVEYRDNVEQEVTESSNKELFSGKAILFQQRCQNYKSRMILSGQRMTAALLTIPAHSGQVGIPPMVQ